MVDACERCGQPHPKCKAHNRKGGPCGGNRLAGQDVCYFHGGSSPQALAAANKRVAIAEVSAELARVGQPVLTDPGQALLDLVAEAAGNVAFYRHLVQGLEQRFIDLGPAVHVEADDSGDEDGGGVTYQVGAGIAGRKNLDTLEALRHVYLAMYDDERDRLARYAALALKAGIEERRVQVAEAQAERLFGAVATALASAQLTVEQQEAFRRALAEQLRQLPPAG